ncbi:hypothetical protein BGZ73_001169, partial [Actinomortierella ambigua]
MTNLANNPPVITMPSNQPLPAPATADSTPQMRDYNDAVLYSCNQTHVSDAEKQRTLNIVDALELRPFAMKDSDRAEQTAWPMFRSLPSCLLVKVKLFQTCPSPGLEYVLSISPFSASLQRRKYIEIDKGVCELFNRDWEFSPQLRFACPKILSGCLLFNNQNGQAIIVNIIEPYGRTRLVDAHREPFIIRKGQPLANSLPPSITTPHKNAWPTT